MIYIKAIVDKRSRGNLEYLKKLKKQIPFATVLALNSAARRVMQAEAENFSKVFDRPNNYTKGSLRVAVATKKTMVATIETKKPSGKSTNPASFLIPQNDGVERSVKRFERMLAENGFMPRGWVAVPAKGLKLDSFGNVPRRLYKEIVQSLQARMGHGPRQPAKRVKVKERGFTAEQLEFLQIAAQSEKAIRDARFFCVLKKRGGLQPGIWERERTTETGRKGGRIWRSKPKPVFIYVRSTRYKKRLNFEQIGQTESHRILETEFNQALDQAMATAK